MTTTYLVTGANRGIGLELCRQLTGRGERVIGACRRSSDALDALGVQVEPGVDVTDDDSVQALQKRLEGTRIDVLIHNAGVLAHAQLESLNFDVIRHQFEVNALGPLRLTVALLGNLGSGSKVAVVTSRMGSLDDNTSGGAYGYRMSKAAVNMAGRSLARDLADRGVSVALLHPGWVRTDMTKQRGLVDVDESAAGLIARIDALTLQNSGSFWHANGERLPW